MDEKDLFLKKFEEKLKTQLDKATLSKLSKGTQIADDDEDITSIDYDQFRIETLPRGATYYEKYANFCEKILNTKPDGSYFKKFQQEIYEAHLGCTPTGAQSAAIFTAIIGVMTGLIFMLLVSMTIGFGILLVGLFMYMIFLKIPGILAQRMKSKASDQIIISIFYIVAYMRFNSNFELAVNFAANYLGEPLSLDFKRLLWEISNAKYPSLKKAFDNYLEKWRDENLEFLEAIYLIESSLYESEELRRIGLLDKALEIILKGNYEKMIHFAQDLRGRVATFNMIGVVLPILGLIILPLAASFGDPKGTWEVVLLLYNIIIPILVGYFGLTIVFKRPSSVNSVKTPKNVKGIKKMMMYEMKLSKNKSIYLSPKIPAFFVFGLFLFIGLIPLLLHGMGVEEIEGSCKTNIEDGLNRQMANIFPESPFGTFQQFKFIDKEGHPEGGYCYGPYGTYSGLLSLFIPLSIAFGIGYYLRYRYKKLISIRNKTKNLEKEFPSATFQLGNRINEGISAELAFGAVADTMKGTETGEFFSKIDKNIKFNGMSIKNAVFDEFKGAINEYPSDIINSSMKILVNAIDRGPEITAKTLIDLSQYLTDMHMSEERLLDLLSESLGSMKGQVNFLAPLISGIVISIVSLVTMIMGALKDSTAELAQAGGAELGTASFLGDSMPTYLFQGVVGIYIVMIIIILVYLTVNLEFGEDKIFIKYQIGEKLISGMTKYSIVVTIGILLFTFVGAKVLPALS